MWVREVYDPAQALSEPRARAEEVVLPMTNDRKPRCQGEWLRITLSLALQDFNGKINVLVKAIPKQPPEGDVSGMGPAG